MSVYVGLDSSTQSLTAVVIEIDGPTRRVVWQHSLRFDDDFPRHGTVNGVLPSEDPLVVHSSPILWADALDSMMKAIAEQDEFDASKIRAIAGSGQQHGSVYTRAAFPRRLEGLEPGRDLADQLEGVFSRATSPVWMDSSTGAQCREIEEAVGGSTTLAELTGSKAFERFTGPQIRKFWQDDSEAFSETACIHLVSSYMATLLAGKHAPIDPGDGAGMNLMDLAGKEWARAVLDATAPGLDTKLPPIEESWTVVGPLASYWVERYGLSPSTRVVAWSGDNPCSLIGVGLVSSGRLAISLGTSDTLFGYLPDARVDPAAEGHAFGAPTGDYMSLICFKNGSLAREHIREQCGLDWPGFSSLLRESAPGNGGSILLPWLEPEITPNVVAAGIRRYQLEEGDAAKNVRGVIEGQMMSMAIHSRWMGVEPKSIYATGGAACNREILEVMANVFDSEVYQFEVGNSAALGAALRAFHADEVASGGDVSWEALVGDFARPVTESKISPNRSAVVVYNALKDVYSACENHARGLGPDPADRISYFRKEHGA